MRGGRFEQRKGDGNVRDAEALLESRSVAEIRQVEAATRKEIQDKQEELRQLVGASYRDLIDSADSILIMANCCHSIMSNLTGMEQSLNSISVAVDAVETRGNSCDREEVYGTGSRVKYLVDTPEKIWGCLDEHMYLEGAERYLRARQVHTLLLNTNATSTRFPLLRHQWPLVETFHGQISTRARERLQDTGLSASEYAVALAAIAIVEDLSSSQLFSLFLDTRKAWLRNYIRAAVQPGANNLHVLLCKAVDMIHVTLSHIGQLFLEVSHGTAPLVFATILTAPPSSQLFGGIPNPDREVAAWRLHREKLEENMEPLPGEVLAQGSLSFLEVCGQELSVEAEPIFGAISSGKELAELELCLRLHMDKQTVLQDSLDWLKSGFGQVISSPWDVLTTLLLKTSLNLWDTIFEGLFVQRVKSIIDSRMDMINIVEAVDMHLKAIQTSTCCQKPCIGLVRSMALLNGTDDTRQLSVKEREWLGEISLYFGPEVSHLQQEVDSGLKRILEDLLMFVGNPQGSSRISELAPFLHDKVMRCMSKISDDIQMRLRELSRRLNQSSSSPDNMVHIERALFLGRLALSLGEHLDYLPVILGPPDQWTSDAAGGAVKESAHFQLRRNHWPEERKNWTSRGDETSHKFRDLQSRLATQWDVAHTLWVAWSTEMLADKFFKDLCMDVSLSTSASKGWEETVIKQETDGAEVEIKISLPATASPSAVGLLFAANQEIYRVGGHTLNKRIVHSFVSELLDKVLSAYERFLLSAYERFLAEHTRIPERGSIQLLFDIRFLADVLVGMQEEVGRKQRERREEKLLSALHKNLDPIDWATYEPQLWENEQRSYQRCAVLFGYFTQLNRLHTDLPVKNQPGTEANIMALSTSVARFTSLPISVPVVSSGGVQHPKESTADYTFDDSAVGLTSSVNSRPLLKSLMGQVGSRIGEGTLRFGSIIGDGQVGRLRDRSAAAISTFGDMLPQALSSLDAWNVPLA